MFCPDCGYNNNDESTFCFACGALLKKTLQNGRYTIKKFLAKGGVEQVFLAYDEKMQAEIVIKQLIPCKDKDQSQFEYLTGKIKEEASMLYRLNYGGLPKVMDFFEEQNDFFLTMQYIEGEDLDQYIQSKPEKRIEYKTCIRWFDRLLEIVAFLHNQTPPIIHRDIKPRNIMIDKTGELYLVDFNIACFLADNRNSFTKVGTVEYAPPESFTGKIDQRSDIYSIGATFFHLFTGVSPADREHPASFPPARTYVPEMAESVETILKKMTSYAKEDRYSSCNEIRTILRQDPSVASILAGIDFIPDVKAGSDKSDGKITGRPSSSGEKDTEIQSEPNQGKSGPQGSAKSAKKGKRSLAVPVIFAAVILICAVFFSRQFFTKTKPADEVKPEIFRVTALSPEKGKISQMTEIAEGENLHSTMKLHFKYETKGKIFKVLTYFENRSDAVFTIDSVKTHGIDVALRENPIDGIAIQIGGDYNTKAEAEKAVSYASKKLPKLDFYVVEKPVSLPVPVYELVVSDINDIQQAQRLRTKLTKFSSDVNIIKQ
ncbi:MAG: protein kinase [Firmicutes bacterium]|nr:protein kinase [Bacillota bacterium]